MSNEERAAIVNLMREHVRAIADIAALKSILMLERGEQRVSGDWHRDFEEIRRSADYAARIAASEPGITKINESLAEDVEREDNELVALIGRLPHHEA